VLLHRYRIAVVLCILAPIVLAAVYLAPRTVTAPGTLPDSISDADFWNIVSNFSEMGGYFRSDNFISNESTYQWVVPDLKTKLKPGGVYLGVGPDQNFTYITAMHPAVAFITDIRRQNMLLHLMYKALFEMSSNRAEFLSKLFGRPLPDKVRQSQDLESLFHALSHEDPDTGFARQTVAGVLEQLRANHHFALALEDSKTIDYIYNAFVSGGPDIRYSFPSQYASRRFPSYAELMLETDENGESHSYMASEENFQTMKRFEAENRLIPVVGDFAGDKALRSIGKYLKQHGSTVTAFYTSNVEFYLFQSDDWRKFLDNVLELPADRNSVIIRAYFNNYGIRYANGSNSRSETLVDPIQDLTNSFKANEIHSYFDLIKRSTAP